jgi:hypothetical protein
MGDAKHSEGALLIDGEASTPTFIPPHTKDMVTGYVLVSNPTLYSGQTVRAVLEAADKAVDGRLFMSHYGPEDESIRVDGPAWRLEQGETREVCWVIPDSGGYPIHEIGIELSGAVLLDRMDWSGIPTVTWPPLQGTMWPRAWACSLNRWEYKRDAYEFLTHNEGIGLLTQGHREWRDYRFEVRLTPRMAVSSGVAVRVQGLRRFYSFVFGAAGEVRIDKSLDGRRTLAKASFQWEAFRNYDVAFEAEGPKLRAFIDGVEILRFVDHDHPLLEGAFGFVVEEGCLGAGTPGVRPL